MDDVLFPSPDDIFPSSRKEPKGCPTEDGVASDGVLEAVADDGFGAAANENTSAKSPVVPKNCPTKGKSTTANQNFSLDYILGDAVKMPPELVLVTRKQWRAKPPIDLSRPKSHPSCIVMFTYATDTKSCSEPEKCEKIVRKLQQKATFEEATDIPYNFLVGGDGRVYEGRGWHLEPEYTHQYYQLRGHVLQIAFIGNYRVKRPPDIMLDAALELIDYGKNNFRIDENFGLVEDYVK